MATVGGIICSLAWLIGGKRMARRQPNVFLYGEALLAKQSESEAFLDGEFPEGSI